MNMKLLIFFFLSGAYAFEMYKIDSSSEKYSLYSLCFEKMNSLTEVPFQTKSIKQTKKELKKADVRCDLDELMLSYLEDENKFYTKKLKDELCLSPDGEKECDKIVKESLKDYLQTNTLNTSICSNEDIYSTRKHKKECQLGLALKGHLQNAKTIDSNGRQVAITSQLCLSVFDNKELKLKSEMELDNFRVSDCESINSSSQEHKDLCYDIVNNNYSLFLTLKEKEGLSGDELFPNTSDLLQMCQASAKGKSVCESFSPVVAASCQESIKNAAIKNAFAIRGCEDNNPILIEKIKDKCEKESSLVVGSEDYLRCEKSVKTSCKLSRAGNELLRNIGGELAQEEGAVGIMARLGLSAASCVPRGALDKKYEDQNKLSIQDLCLSYFTSLDEANYCIEIHKGILSHSTFKECKSENLDCRLTSIAVTKACLEQDNGNYNLEKCLYSSGDNQGVSLINRLHTAQLGVTQDSNRMVQNRRREAGLCLAGAAMGALGEIDENIAKFGNAAIGTLSCLRQGPSKEQRLTLQETCQNEANKNSTECQEYKTRAAMRDSCLVNQLGSSIAAELKGDARKIFETLYGAASSIRECTAIPNEGVAGLNGKVRDKQKDQCFMRAGFNMFADLFNENENLALGIGLAGNALSCMGLTGAELTRCISTGALSSLGAHIKDPKLAKAFEAASQVAAAAFSAKDCLNGGGSGADQGACIAQSIAGLIPGQAGSYVQWGLSGYKLIPMLKGATCLDTKLQAGGALASWGGEFITTVLQEGENKSLGKDYERREKEAERYKKINGVYPASYDPQVMAFDYQIEAQAVAIKTLQRKRPFVYIGTAMTAAAQLVSALKILGFGGLPTCISVPPGTAAQDMAKCAAGAFKPNLFKQKTSLFSFEKEDFDVEKYVRSIQINDKKIQEYVEATLSDEEAFFAYQEMNRLKLGLNQSMSLDDYKKSQQFSLNDFDISIKQAILMSYKIEQMLNPLMSAHALDVEGIAVGTAESIFSGGNNFSRGNPLSYAEDMIFLSLSKVMEKTGDFPGKRALYFAARKATQVLVCTHAKAMNKLMMSTPGKLAVGAYTLYNNSKVIVDIEKSVKENKKLQNETQKRRDDFVEGKVVQSESPFDSFMNQIINPLDFVIDKAYAKQAEKIYVCMDFKGQINQKCECANSSSGCIRPYPRSHSEDQDLKTMVTAQPKMMGPLEKMVGFLTKEVTDLFGGSKSIDDVNVEKIQAMTTQLNQASDNLIQKINEKRQKEGKKPFEVEEAAKMVEGELYASLSPEMRKGLFEELTISDLKKGLSSGSEGNLKENTPDLAKPSDNPQLAQEQSVKRIEEALERTPAKEESAASVKENIALNKALEQKYDYSQAQDDLYQGTSGIFSVISSRYKKIFSP